MQLTTEYDNATDQTKNRRGCKLHEVIKIKNALGIFVCPVCVVEEAMTEEIHCPKGCGSYSGINGLAVHWGRMHDEEKPEWLQEQLSAARSGENNPFYGQTFEHTDEAKREIGKRSKQRWQNSNYRDEVSEAISNTLEGHDVSLEEREQISESLRQGDGSNYPLEWTSNLREDVRDRHDRECVLCGIVEDELDVRLDVHHIDGDKTNCEPENLVPLCRSCHAAITAEDHLTELQLSLFAWQQENYPNSTVWTDIAGIAEEFGELASTQIDVMIGREPEKFDSNEEAMKDAIGDVLIYLSQLASKHNISFAQALHSASAEIQDEESHHG
jgi:NTP pyrophosphatase (non-canonical NTP hydrolase)